MKSLPMKINTPLVGDVLKELEDILFLAAGTPVFDVLADRIARMMVDANISLVFRLGKISWS